MNKQKTTDVQRRIDIQSDLHLMRIYLMIVLSFCFILFDITRVKMSSINES